ncbi:MAG: protein kinase [archaeon]|nr:protein kinase [archaeon]
MESGKKESEEEFFDFLSIPDNPEELFELDDKLGEGRYGKVFKGIHLKTKKEVAIKIIPKSKIRKYSLKKEISIMKLCFPCEYILNYYGSYYSIEKDEIWIILELCEIGSIIALRQVMKRNFEENEIASIIEMTLRALSYLHKNKIIHRDIKGANILLNKQGKVKLADFGEGAQITQKKIFRKEKRGTPYWMSPQVIGQKPYDMKADIWSLGITCYELSQGDPPLGEYKRYKVMNIIENKPPTGLPENNTFSEEFNDFVNKCLTYENDLRPSAEELLNHKFIKDHSLGEKQIKRLINQFYEELYKLRKEFENISENNEEEDNGSSFSEENNNEDKEESKKIVSSKNTISFESNAEIKEVKKENIINDNKDEDDFIHKSSLESILIQTSQNNINKEEGNLSVLNYTPKSINKEDEGENNSMNETKSKAKKNEEEPLFKKMIKEDKFIFDPNDYIEIFLKEQIAEIQARKEKTDTKRTKHNVESWQISKDIETSETNTKKVNPTPLKEKFSNSNLSIDFSENEGTKKEQSMKHKTEETLKFDIFSKFNENTQINFINTFRKDLQNHSKNFNLNFGKRNSKIIQNKMTDINEIEEDKLNQMKDDKIDLTIKEFELRRKEEINKINLKYNSIINKLDSAKTNHKNEETNTENTFNKSNLIIEKDDDDLSYIKEKNQNIFTHSTKDIHLKNNLSKHK